MHLHTPESPSPKIGGHIMKKSLLLLSFLWISVFSFSQNVEFIGLIKDSLSNEPVFYASVIAFNEQDSAVAGAVTDKRGRFTITVLQSKDLVLKISSFGYAPLTISLPKSTKKRVELDPILLTPDVQKLAPFEVTGTAPRIERKFDKTVYKIEEATIAASLTIYDLLRTLPGVSVEDNGTITYKGTTPDIHVDNTPSRLLYPNLLAIPVDRVEKVELIDASMRRGGRGNAGIINIKLKKITDDGLSGCLSTKPSTTSFRDVNESAHLVNLNYKKKKNTFVSNTNLNTGLNKYEYIGYYDYFDNPIVSDSVIRTLNLNSYSSRYSFSECLGYLYQKDENTKFTFSIAGDYSKDFSHQIERETQKNEITNDIINSFWNDGKSTWREPFGSVGINYWHQIDSNDQYIESNMYYHLSNGKSNSNLTQHIEFLSSEFKDSITNFDSYSENQYPQSLFFDLFYNKPFSDYTRINVYYFTENQFHQKNRTRVYENNILNRLKNKDDHYLDIYQTLSVRLGTEYKKWKWDAGLSIEDQFIYGTYRRVDDLYQDSTRMIRKNYFKLLPSFAIGYLINDEQELKLSGSITSDNVGFHSLQDFIYKDNFKWFSGNSDLKPHNLYSIYFGYSISKNKWNGAIDLFYSYSNNFSSPVVVQITDVITLNKRYNVAEINNLGANISLWFRIKKLSVSIFSKWYFRKYNINKLRLIAQDLNMPHTTPNEINFSYYVYASLSYRVKKFTAQSTLFYFGKQYHVSSSSNGFMNLSISLNYRFLKDKLLVGIGAKNLLRDLFENKNEGNQFGITSQGISSGYAYQPSFFVSIRYNLNLGSRNTEHIKGRR